MHKLLLIIILFGTLAFSKLPDLNKLENIERSNIKKEIDDVNSLTDSEKIVYENILNAIYFLQQKSLIKL